MLVAQLLIGIIALLHFYFLMLEMFFWDKPMGLRAFGHSREAAKASKKLAMNMGLYNGFLAAGLLWGLWLGQQGQAILIFFLSCILIAGIFGGFTASKKIIWIQALPALLALVLLLA